MHRDEYEVDPTLKHHYPLKGQQAYTIINVWICEQNSEQYGYADGDKYGVDSPLNHHYLLKGQQTYIIINVCTFVNTIQKEVDMGLNQQAHST